MDIPNDTLSSRIVGPSHSVILQSDPYRILDCAEIVNPAIMLHINTAVSPALNAFRNRI